MSGLHFTATMATENFNEGINRIEQGLSSVGGVATSMAKSLAGFAGAFGAQQLIGKVVEVRGEMQQLEVAFKTMLGSEEKAANLMNQLVETAAKTPFDLGSVSQGAKQLLAYGTAAEEVNETLTRLGDIAAGLSIPLGDLVYLYGTTMTQGRMYTMDLRQFMGRGIPMAEELAKQFGVTKDKVGELVTAGKVGAEEVKAAIWSMTSEGGKFGGLMSEQSKTITGQISNIGDSFQQMFNKIGQQSEGVINTALSGGSYLVEHYEEVGKVLGACVVAYGTYKTALIAVTAANKALLIAERQRKDVEYADLGLKLKRIAAAEKHATATQREALAKRKAAAEEKRAAIASRQDATAKQLDTIATARNTSATNTATAAQKRLNLAALKNPYVIAAAAVAALAVGVYKLATADTAAERAQKRLNKEVESYTSLIDERKARMDEILSSLRDEATTTQESIRLYNELKALAPALTGQYTRQQLATENLTAAQKALNESFDEEELRHYADEIKKTEGLIESLKESQQASVEAGGAGIGFTRNIEKQEAYLEELKKKYNELTEAKKQAAKEDLPADVRIKLNEDDINRFKQEIKNLQEALDNLKVNAEGEVADRPNEILLTGQIHALQKQVDTLTAENDKLKDTHTAKPTDSDPEATERAYERKALKEEQALNRQREEEDRQISLRQAQINALGEGTYKDSEQKALNHKKKLVEIERGRQDAIRAIREADVKLWLKEGADRKEYQYRDRLPSSAYDPANSYYDSLAGLENDSYTKSLQMSLTDALADIEDFEQKRMAIEKKYAERRKALYEEDGVTLRKGVSRENLSNLEDLRREELKALDVETAEKSGDYARFVSGLEEQTTEQLLSALKALSFQLSRDAAGSDLAGSGSLSEEERSYIRAQMAAVADALKERQDGRQGEEEEGEGGKGKDTLQEYKALTDLLSEAGKSFEELGNTIGEAAGEALKLAGSLFSSAGSLWGAFSTIKESLTGGTGGGLDLSSFAGGISGAVSAAVAVVNAVANVVSANKEANESFAAAAKTYAEGVRDAADSLRLAAAETVFGTDSYKQFKTYAAMAAEGKTTITSPTYVSSDMRSGWQKFLDKAWYRGKNIESINLADFYNEQGELETDRLQAWYDAYADGLTDENKTFIEDLISEWDRYEEALEEMDSYLSDLFSDTTSTLADEMVDAFMSTGGALADTTDNVQDFAKALAKSVVQSYLLEEVFTDDFKEKMSSLIKSGDVASAVALYDKALESIDESGVDELLSQMGAGDWGTSESASASSGGYTTMSEDTASELNGRFTDIQLKVNQITQYLSQNLAGGGLLAGVTAAGGSLTLIQSDVAVIAKNSRNLEEMAANLSKIAKQTKNI